MTITADLTNIPPAIAVAADRVARAEADLAEHSRVAGQAREAQQRVIDRIAALDARRASIATRRADGDRRDGDAGEVELIALDRAELETMRSDAAAMANQTRTAMRQAEQTVAAAKAELVRAEHSVAEQELARHAAALDEVLAETIAKMNLHTRFLGGLRAAWQPSATLSQRLRNLQFGPM